MRDNTIAATRAAAHTGIDYALYARYATYEIRVALRPRHAY